MEDEKRIDWSVDNPYVRGRVFDNTKGKPDNIEMGKTIPVNVFVRWYKVETRLLTFW